jgi:anti-sigma factor RsiW
MGNTMEHVTETEWNEYLSGHIQKDRIAWIDNHIKSCQACRASLEQAVALNELLGQWQVNPCGHEIADKVTQAVQSKTIPFKNMTIYSLQRRLWPNAWPIAAMVLIGLFLGHLAGRISAKHLVAKQEGTAIEIKPTYLAGLDMQFASGLIWSVLEEDQSAGEDKP